MYGDVYPAMLSEAMKERMSAWADLLEWEHSEHSKDVRMAVEMPHDTLSWNEIGLAALTLHRPARPQAPADLKDLGWERLDTNESTFSWCPSLDYWDYDADEQDFFSLSMCMVFPVPALAGPQHLDPVGLPRRPLRLRESHPCGSGPAW